jgi:multiple sugar transport system substrate-binding protein
VVIPAFQQQEQKKGIDVTVNLMQNVASQTSDQQEALDLRSHTGPDVLTLDGFLIPEFASAGLLKPIKKLVASEKSWSGWSKIPANVQQIMAYKGKEYGVPNGPDVRVIWYRKDLFQKAGLPTNWQPHSWTDILNAAETIKAKDPGVTPLQIDGGTAMGEATTMQGLYPLMVSSGNFIYDYKTNKYVVKSPGLLNALDMYQTVYQTKKLGNLDEQLTANGRNQTFSDFRNGKLAIYFGESDYMWRSVLASGQYALANRDQLVGWAKIPARKAGEGYRGQSYVTVSGGTGWTINPSTKNPKVAWDFLSLMFSQTMNQNWLDHVDVIPLRTDVASPDDPVMNGLRKMLPLTVVRPNQPTYNQVSLYAQAATLSVLNGQATPQQAENTYAQQVTQLVGRKDVETQKAPQKTV